PAAHPPGRGASGGNRGVSGEPRAPAGRRPGGQAGSPPAPPPPGGCATGHASLNVRCWCGDPGARAGGGKRVRRVTAAAGAPVAPGQGVRAADESALTMSARLTAAGVPATPENRRAYQEMLVTTPGLAGGISGVILCDETLRQHARAGRTFPVALRELG